MFSLVVDYASQFGSLVSQCLRNGFVTLSRRMNFSNFDFSAVSEFFYMMSKMTLSTTVYDGAVPLAAKQTHYILLPPPLSSYSVQRFESLNQTPINIVHVFGTK
ncbi:hypothetical protein CHARACLAT_001607 [Characodon lateralis]|uniref:Uncharacterized protein n=1 Tax=Characodon lateralis TaxID=208331 RepID=A0ABU7DD48_9TELE|nr:hypothetical protein [Characodon lateralis]